MTDNTAQYAKLEQRVDGIEKSVGTISHEMRNISMMLTDRQRGGDKLEGRVNAMEGAIEGVSRQITALALKMDERGKPPWTLIISGVALCFTAWGAFGWLIYTPVVKDQARVENDIKAIEAQLVPRAEHGERWRQQERNAERIEKRLDRLEDARIHRNAAAEP